MILDQINNDILELANKADVELKEKWFKFFEKHGFKRIDSYSIVPENDPTVLFTTALV